MCVKMGPDVIINNAFLAAGENIPYLEIIKLKQFSQIVYKIITSSNENQGKYKYLYFQVGESDVEEYIQSTDRFIKGFGRIYSQAPVTESEVRIINSAYSSDIQEMLQQSRVEFTNVLQRSRVALVAM